MCALAKYCTCVLFLFILFTFSREVASLSLPCVFTCLTDLFLRRLLLLNITHLDAQRVPLPLIPCLLRAYYQANNIQQITQHFHLDESSSEGPYSTYGIMDDFIYRSVSLIPQELKSRAEGRRMKERNVSLNNIPNMYKYHSWFQNYRHLLYLFAL